MKKRILQVLLLLSMTTLAGCGNNATINEDNLNTTETLDIQVILKATDSDYWQALLLGAKAAEKDSGGTIKVTSSGPTSEIDFEEQVTILENVIASEPDGILIASGSVDATVPAIENAMDKNIPVITIDNKINTENLVSFIASDHYAAAGFAAEQMIEDWEERGIDPEGKSVFIVSAVAGTTVNSARVNGFTDKITELVPTINVLQTQYADNDIAIATDIVLNTIMANENLIGVFGDNNHMGVGVANAIRELGKKDDIVSYAFDASEDEITAVKEGILTGLIVQNPFGMGYDGVNYLIEAINNKDIEKEIDYPTTIVNIKNIEEDEIQQLLYPK